MMSIKPYESYQDTNIEWLKEIPSDWEISKVKHCFIREKNEKANQEDPIVLSLARDGVKVRDISTGEGQIAESYYHYNPVKPGDLLLNPMDLVSGANCSLSEVEGVISPAYINLKAKKGFNPKYYDYFFKLQYWSMALFAHGKGVSFENRWTINNETLMNYAIPVPDENTQNAIVKFLDKKLSKINMIIKMDKKFIELIEEKKTALINQVVTKGLDSTVPMKDSGIEWIGEIPKHWSIDKLKYWVDLNTSSLSENTDDYYEFDYVDIGSVNLEKGIEKYEHMVFKDSPSRARRIVKKDDIIVSTVRTYLKAIAVIPDKEDIIVSTGFAVLTPRNINSRFLAYLTKSDYFVNLVSANSEGVSYPAINSSVLINLKILIPPDEEQTKIGNYLDKEISEIDKITEKISENINLLEEYKTSLIHHVVTGKIDVRDEI